MVLRPTILRYKGKVKKIDRDKIANINSKSTESIYKEAKALPRIGLIMGIGTIIVIFTPVVYVSYK